MKKAVIILLILLVSSFAKDFKNIKFDEFLQILSHTTNKNIVVSDSVDKNMHLFLPNYDFNNKKLSKKLLYNIIKMNKLSYKSFDNVLLIYKKDENKNKKPVINTYRYKLKYLNIKDIEKILSIYSDVRFIYLDTTNTLLFKTDPSTAKEIFSFIKTADIEKLQKTIKITIFITNTKKIKELGNKINEIDLNQYGQFKTNEIYNILFNLSLKKDFVFSYEYKLAFNTFLKYLVKNDYSQIVQSPYLLLRDGEKVEFNSGKNIPFLQSTAKVEDNKISSQATYDYRDVGLKVSISPRIFNNFLFLDMDLLVENLLSISKTPITSKIHLKNKFKLKSNQLLVLSGLYQDNFQNEIFKVPIIGDIPVLEYLFKSENKNINRYILTIFIEVI